MDAHETRTWINNRLHIVIEDNKYSDVWNFVLLWNLFESQLYDCYYSANKANEINCKLKTEVETTGILSHFQNRYVENNNTNKKFDKLRLRPNDSLELVKNVLLGKNTDSKDIMTAIVIIISRYRNNLFHGEKAIASLAEQERNFEVANKFLIACLEANN